MSIPYGACVQFIKPFYKAFAFLQGVFRPESDARAATLNASEGAVRQRRAMITASERHPRLVKTRGESLGGDPFMRKGKNAAAMLIPLQKQNVGARGELPLQIPFHFIYVRANAFYSLFFNINIHISIIIM